jgi:hypothetical protein
MSKVSSLLRSLLFLNIILLFSLFTIAQTPKTFTGEWFGYIRVENGQGYKYYLRISEGEKASYIGLAMHGHCRKEKRIWGNKMGVY